MAAIEVSGGSLGCCYKPDEFDSFTQEIFNLYFETISYQDIKETLDLRRLGEDIESAEQSGIYNDLGYLIIYFLNIKRSLLCDTTKTYLDFISDKELQCFKDYFFCKDIDIDCFINKLGFYGASVV